MDSAAPIWGTDESSTRTAVRDTVGDPPRIRRFPNVSAGTCLAKFIGMTTSRSSEKPHGSPRVDQEKSTEDVFEHVIRGVRLNRLRDLLRRGRRDDDDTPRHADI